MMGHGREEKFKTEAPDEDLAKNPKNAGQGKGAADHLMCAGMVFYFTKPVPHLPPIPLTEAAGDAGTRGNTGPPPATRAMKSKIEPLGSIKKEFPPRGNLQLFQLEKPATFTCTLRKVEVTYAKVALGLRTGDLLSNGAFGQLIAGQLPKA